MIRYLLTIGGRLGEASLYINVERGKDPIERAKQLIAERNASQNSLYHDEFVGIKVI